MAHFTHARFSIQQVRRFRPPGNFGDSQLDQYTSAPIPVCTGVQFMLGAFVERVYVEAALESRRESEHTSSMASKPEVLRRMLAIPYSSQPSVQCIVVSWKGFDSVSLPERAIVASHLWAKGVSAEYMPHSGVMLSLLKHAGTEAVVSDTNVWTVDQIFDLCCILRIPFVVVVQLRLLKESKTVRLRHTIDPSSAPNEYETIPLASLASEIRDRIRYGVITPNDRAEYERSIPTSPHSTHKETSSSRTRMSTLATDFECVYVDTDQFYVNLDKASGKDQKLKAVLKVTKTIQLKAGPYIEDGLHNLLVVDLPFRIIREFNSAAMYHQGPSIVAGTMEFLEKHSKHKRTLKTFALCLDFLLRHYDEEKAKPFASAKETLLSILVYSCPDDRFDLLTLETYRDAKNNMSNDSTGSKAPRKR